MSDMRIALVAEGKTDQIVIEAALKAILDRPFILTLLQPETSDPFGGAGSLGGGWGGVYRWCRQVVSMLCPVAENPDLAEFDMILLHVDADVAGMRYADANIRDGRTDLPCELPCPPAADTVNALREVVARWLDLPSAGDLPGRWLFCNPSKCVEAWLFAGYENALPLLMGNIMQNIECKLSLESWLSIMPIRNRCLIRGGKKRTAGYRKAADQIQAEWRHVVHSCSQSARFDGEVRASLGVLGN